ncbi:MAG TPA: response regulator [Stellaceae bacterium]|nr:response regulator [Stellaceae bacterium]
MPDQPPYPTEPRIAIVDDDQPVREALQRMLRSHGFATTVFASAEQFLAGPGPTRTSCLILDVRMPGMTGLALHQHLVSQGCRIPTILITACPTSAERERAVASGASYLAKPLGERVLLDAVRDVLARGEQAAAEGLPR